MQRGFTLLEVLIVVAVFGIFLAMAVPWLGNSIAQQELNNAAQQMVTELRYLQQITINSDETTPFYRMVFSTSQYYIASGINIQKTITLPASVQIYGTPADMIFSKYDGGTPTAQTIQLRSSRLNKSLYVKIHPNRGRVRIDTGPGLDL